MSAVMNRSYGIVRKSMGKSLAELAKERSEERAKQKALEEQFADTEFKYSVKSKHGLWNTSRIIDVPLDFEESSVFEDEPKPKVNKMVWVKTALFFGVMLVTAWAMWP